MVCEMTLPPWVPLFSIAGAVVSDVGGVLSHCAIVAREFGVPAVVGTQVGGRSPSRPARPSPWTAPRASSTSTAAPSEHARLRVSGQGDHRALGDGEDLRVSDMLAPPSAARATVPPSRREGERRDRPAGRDQRAGVDQVQSVGAARPVRRHRTRHLGTDRGGDSDEAFTVGHRRRQRPAVRAPAGRTAARRRTPRRHRPPRRRPREAPATERHRGTGHGGSGHRGSGGGTASNIQKPGECGMGTGQKATGEPIKLGAMATKVPGSTSPGSPA